MFKIHTLLSKSLKHKYKVSALYPHLAKEETVVDMNFISLSRQKCFFGLPIALTPNLLEEHSAFF